MSDQPEQRHSENPANGNDSTKVEEGQTPLNLDDLEKEIEQHDPEFSLQIRDLEISASDLDIEMLDLDQVLADEEAKSLKVRFKIARRKLILYFKIFATSLEVQARMFFQETVPAFLEKIKSILKQILESLKDVIGSIKAMSTKGKLGLLGIIVFAGLTTAYIIRATKGVLFHSEDQTFIRSMKDLADKDKEFTFDPDEQMEPFYESPRIAQNIVSLAKIVVNIKRSENSGANPMAAFEFYMEGTSPEVIIEVKDREYEFRDLFQRTVEEMTYDELDTVEGKKILLEHLRKGANQVISSGIIKKVMIKQVILKP